MVATDFTLYFKPVTTKKELNRCFELRYQVYCNEKKWLRADDHPLQIETDEFDDKALHYIAMDDDFNIVGMMRILRSSDFKELPYTHHPALKDKNHFIPGSAELSRFIITATKNRNAVIKGLFRTIYQNSMKLGLNSWVILVEPSLLRYFTRFYYFCKPLTTPAMYFGAFTYPAICDIKKHERLWKNKYPANYKFNQEEYTILSSTEDVIK